MQHIQKTHGRVPSHLALSTTVISAGALYWYHSGRSSASQPEQHSLRTLRGIGSTHATNKNASRKHPSLLSIPPPIVRRPSRARIQPAAANRLPAPKLNEKENLRCASWYWLKQARNMRRVPCPAKSSLP